MSVCVSHGWWPSFESRGYSAWCRYGSKSGGGGRMLEGEMGIQKHKSVRPAGDLAGCAGLGIRGWSGRINETNRCWVGLVHGGMLAGAPAGCLAVSSAGPPAAGERFIFEPAFPCRPPSVEVQLREQELELAPLPRPLAERGRQQRAGRRRRRIQVGPADTKGRERTLRAAAQQTEQGTRGAAAAWRPAAAPPAAPLGAAESPALMPPAPQAARLKAMRKK